MNRRIKAVRHIAMTCQTCFINTTCYAKAKVNKSVICHSYSKIFENWYYLEERNSYFYINTWDTPYILVTKHIYLIRFLCVHLQANLNYTRIKTSKNQIFSFGGFKCCIFNSSIMFWGRTMAQGFSQQLLNTKKRVKSRPLCVGFVLDSVTLGQAFL
jgi:hypothetical protein